MYMKHIYILYFIFNVNFTFYTVIAMSFDVRLRDTSFAYGIEETDKSAINSTYYEAGQICNKNACELVNTKNENVNFCLTYGLATIKNNGDIFSGILCPEGYDLQFNNNKNDNMMFRLIENNVQSDINYNQSDIYINKPLIIYSQQMEMETIGFFDNIIPKRAYLMTYASSYYMSCQFDNSSYVLENGTKVCYHAGLRKLISPSEYYVNGKQQNCVVFYQLWDDAMKSFLIMENLSILDSSSNIINQIKWSFVKFDQCSVSTAVATFNSLMINFMFLFCFIIYIFIK